MRECSRGKETQAIYRQYACTNASNNSIVKSPFLETTRDWVLGDEGGINVNIVSGDHDVVQRKKLFPIKTPTKKHLQVE